MLQQENMRMMSKLLTIKSTLGNWKEREKTLKKYSQLASRTVTVQLPQPPDIDTIGEAAKKKRRRLRPRRGVSAQQ